MNPYISLFFPSPIFSIPILLLIIILITILLYKTKNQNKKEIKEIKALIPNKFQKYIITEIKQLTSSVKFVKFQYVIPTENPKKTKKIGLDIPLGHHITLRASVDGKKIYRTYTPVSYNKESLTIGLCIKIQEKGQISKFIDSAEIINSQVELSGPKGMFFCDNKPYQDIYIIAGGIGITVFARLIDYFLLSHPSKPKIHLLYTSKIKDDFIFIKKFEKISSQFPQRFQYTLQIKNQYVGFLTEEDLSSFFFPLPNDYSVLISAPIGLRKLLREIFPKLKIDDQSYYFF
ncbi:NADH-cytochrome b5 reductase [Anaeramoeba ignava]|uniref:NADH-cytochrome b5 reductase n=1 Tax=Anaeramoeba ignava TaxID=1746090 RepID=A0A9Q0LFL8_ANAIG|nr:NADH-cytochrome b5 reductase [Anaeramoeba ignava]